MQIFPSHLFKVAIISFAIGITGCANDDPSIKTPTTQKRINQTRIFSAPSQEILLQTILTTLQDQGYNIVKVNSNNAEITAQRDGNVLISVIAYQTNPQQFAVRANAQRYIRNANLFSNNTTGYEIIMDPVFYQKDFFEPLSKSLFIQKENLSN
ncbi:MULTISPECIES: hypothetical protein [Commensalibacter]|uniref:Uncharacterized protein n=2 Tax=Commensalibacter TaxID=1079922 RepID=W7E1E1_9PROT|nr:MULTISPECIES: hypothetical protein [Commensalibacter]EUK18889.1 hypothetical protein COMX_04045 [Commensalibacter papalotli (ex Servin-Garciduenas et al. 2014)]CAI3925788.1 unnamed protein product [Commensalibacter papalotli (ex Botero et al. 2024)]CAI3926267.1 unnamed protein product [Commensalibacter papalotli (ex Botero et al. 2024)]